MKNVGTELSLSTTYHPQSNGQTKRVNQILEIYLRCMCMRQPKSWHRWLAMAQWWYNFSHHASTRMTPFEVIYGYKPFALPATGGQTIGTDMEEYLQQRREVLQQLKQELTAAQNRMKQNANKMRSDQEFEVGERVYLRLRYPHLKAITQGKYLNLALNTLGHFPSQPEQARQPTSCNSLREPRSTQSFTSPC